MEKTSELSNKVLKELVEKMNNPKVVIAHHNIHSQGATKEDIFGSPNNNQNDGIHLNGLKGRNAIQTSFINIFNKSLN